jgi:hypothetical protein
LKNKKSLSLTSGQSVYLNARFTTQTEMQRKCHSQERETGKEVPEKKNCTVLGRKRSHVTDGTQSCLKKILNIKRNTISSHIFTQAQTDETQEQP